MVQTDLPWIRLVSLMETEEYGNALKSLDTDFSSTKDDLTPVRVSILIRQERYVRALHSLDAHPSPLPSSLLASKVYCLSQLGKHAEANAALQEVRKHGDEEDKVFLQHLRAFVAWKAGDYPQAMEATLALLDLLDVRDELTEDTLTNALAVQAASPVAGLSFASSTHAATLDQDIANDTEDAQFNHAIHLLRQGRLDEANRVIEPLRRLEQEDASILLLRACLAEKQNKREEMKNLLEQIISTPEVENSVLAVALNNASLCQESKDKVRAEEYMKRAMLHSVFQGRPQLLPNQKNCLQRNALVHGIGLGKLKGRKPSSSLDASTLPILRASTLMSLGRRDRAIKVLETAHTHQPASTVLSAALAQMYINGGAYPSKDALSRAAECMKRTITAQASSPSLTALGLLAYLYDQAGRVKEYQDVLEQALSQVSRAKEQGPSQVLLNAHLLCGRGQESQAMELLEQGVRTYQDPRLITSLIALYANIDMSRAEGAITSLGLGEVDTSDLDVDALESSMINSLKKTRKMKNAVARDGNAPKKTRAPKSLRKRLARRRLLAQRCAQVNAQVVEDRWLPVHVRASAKQQRGKKGGKKGGASLTSGSQGMALEGGGMGMTGSARIAGAKAVPAVTLEEVEDEDASRSTQTPDNSKKQQQQTGSSNASSNKGKGKKKKKGGRK